MCKDPCIKSLATKPKKRNLLKEDDFLTRRLQTLDSSLGFEPSKVFITIYYTNTIYFTATSETWTQVLCTSKVCPVILSYFCELTFNPAAFKAPNQLLGCCFKTVSIIKSCDISKLLQIIRDWIILRYRWGFFKYNNTYYYLMCN